MELRQAIESTDVAEINAKLQALQEAAQPLASALYAEAGQAASGAGNGGGATTPEGDEIVEDADYEVIDEDEAAKRS